MDIYEEAERIVGEVNRELADEGDKARIRYMLVESDDLLEDGWVVRTFWELPHPAGEIWPFEQLRGYEHRLGTRLDDKALAVCRFRDPDEIRNPDYHIGQPVPEPA